MAHPYDRDDEFVAVDGVENAVVPLPYTVLVVTREFLVPWRTRILGKTLNSMDDLDPVGFRKGFNFLGC